MYDVLKLSKSASQDEIKKAFHQLALQYHPDKHANLINDEKSLYEEAMKEIINAYDILSDSIKCARYDQSQSPA